ncbi:MAG: flagellar basal body L-ring protein FlgH [Planctomycetia bacterium]|nr:flagellar basal body L-ring protein FlgH [Planctomycetia bacterium]
MNANAGKLIITGAVTLAMAGSIGAQPPNAREPAPLNLRRENAAAPETPPEAGIPGQPADPGGAPPTGEAPPAGLGPTTGALPMPGGIIGPAQPPLHRHLRRQDVSWIYIDRPRPRKVGVHDIITVTVDEKSEVTQASRFNRQRNSVYTAQLKEWLRINEEGNLDIAASKSPGINGQLRSQLQSFGQGLSQEGMKYKIAATVVDILPNGTLILEAHKTIRTNNEVWEYSLTGRIRSQDVAGNNEVRSENVADLNITKRESGQVKDSTKQGWLQALYDFFLPF